MPQPVITPRQDWQLQDEAGVKTVWYMFFAAITGWMGELIPNAVYGKPVLNTTGKITKVTGPGVIGETRFSESDILALLRSAQSGLAALAATLAASDAGLLVEVTDYRHVLRWSGSAWTWGPGEDGRHDIVALPVDPDVTTGWQLCDGTTVAYLKGDGTTANFTTPDLTSAANKAAYLKMGTPVAGPTAATAPGFTGTPVTPAGTVSAIAAGSGSVNVLASSVTSVSLATHTHPAPTFTGNALTPAGTVDATGEPRNYVLRPWFRR